MKTGSWSRQEGSQVGCAVENGVGAGFFQFGAFAKAAEDAHAPGAGAAGGVDVYSGVANHEAVGGRESQMGSGKLDGLGVGFQAAGVLGAGRDFNAGGNGRELLQKSVDVAAAARGDQADAVSGVQFVDHLGNAGDEVEARRSSLPAFFEVEQGLVQVQHIKQGYQGVARSFHLHGDGARQARSVLAGKGAQSLRQVANGGVIGVNEGAIQVEEDGFNDSGGNGFWHGGEDK